MVVPEALVGVTRAFPKRSAWPGVLRCSGLLGTRDACPASRVPQRRTISAVARWKNGRAATTLIARTAASLVGWRSPPQRAPRALPGTTLCGRRPDAATVFQHNDVSGTCRRERFRGFRVGLVAAPENEKAPPVARAGSREFAACEASGERSNRASLGERDRRTGAKRPRSRSAEELRSRKATSWANGPEAAADQAAATRGGRRSLHHNASAAIVPGYAGQR